MNKILFLILITLLLTSCKEEKHTELENPQKNIIVKKDSFSISLEMPAKTSKNINVWLKPYDEFSLVFKNNSNKDTIITKKLPLFYDYYQMIFLKSKFDENKNLQIIYRHFIASQEMTDLQLKCDSNLIELKNKTSQSILTDSIHKSYKYLRRKHLENKTIGSENYSKELDSLNGYFKKLTNNQIPNSQINEMLYLGEIQEANPKDKRVEEFIKNSDIIMIGHAQLNLLFNYFKNNAELLDYENLNTKNNSETYIEQLAIGAYRFLKLKDNKGDAKYNKAVDWLKTTDFYKRDSTHIRKEITPLNNKKFKEYLSKIEMIDINDKKIKIAEILSENNSKYYLIDFWATWCVPCIQGVKTMNNMVIPKDVKVLSFSVDKKKDKEKWKIKTNELEQKLTFWFDEEIETNKGFTKFMEMQSIPRYVLIDRNMNLIDPAFYLPQEIQFLLKLKDIKNHNYW
ncbi:thioredoxin fold domain-containing protein [Cellulophaga sp. 20_2_10]|uniref:TlpA family protein disulfide reductase n=1 Tax=Cellulophaga sp. 20_2_10 TaxID=2942476 RepID=UPI00201A9C1C|nr:thioredoxin-like domain-containing protein [Cellulophaga sp. 20_2_10]MCL5245330.1 thioredoxin fold domain-containing protein [Cellulophaga sp. 20_2_10]